MKGILIHIRQMDDDFDAPGRTYNIRCVTVGEFDLKVYVCVEFTQDGEIDEVEVNEFFGDHAIHDAHLWIQDRQGILGEIT